MSAPAALDEQALPGNWLEAVPQPILVLDGEGLIQAANPAAEQFFHASINVLRGKPLGDFVPFSSPLLSLVEQSKRGGSQVSGRQIDLSAPRLGSQLIVDVQVSPLPGERGAVVLLWPRAMADRVDRQLRHRNSALSVSRLAAMLAHEVKNPLSGIRGAAQLIEDILPEEERDLARLIRDETDRIRRLVDQMEVFSDERHLARGAVNIHALLEQVSRLARTGFARHARFTENYDPSLPQVFAVSDQLIQVLLNLIKNAAEATQDQAEGEAQITISTAYRSGVSMATSSGYSKVNLPIECRIEDNGPGIPEDLESHIFEPFVTSKTSGTGLGLALAAKVIHDHGGVIEIESGPHGTMVLLLLPAAERTEKEEV